MRCVRAWRFLAVAAALLPTLLAAQPEGLAWTVQRDAFAELWYHGLAAADAPRYGPLPLYAPAYATTRRRDDAPAGAALRRVAPALRAALAADTTFEVLHFVPLWFVGERPDAVLAALKLALASRSTPGDPLAPRAAAVAAALGGSAHRATALAFVDALADEWRGPGAAARGIDDATLAELRHRWETTYEPALAPYLARVGRTRGVILPVPSVGLEGRIAALPDGRTVVVVATGAADTPLLAAVRELAFPLLGTARRRDAHGRAGARPASAGFASARLSLERDRELAAVRAGALLLDAVLPTAAGPYRRVFAAAAGRGEEAFFEQAFPVLPATERALRSAVARSTARPSAP